jgi:branched-subunit amino acid transport protein AzlD
MTDAIYAICIILVMAAVTAIIRFLPFILFDKGTEPPAWVKYLGKVLPPAVMSMLLVYCVRSVNLTGGNHGIPEISCILVAMLLHVWKRNTLLSIGCSTILYMVLVQTVFA